MASMDTGETNSNNDNGNGSHHHPHLHAHFKEQEDVLDAHDAAIPVESCGNGRMNVRLGFLQIQHVYEIRFCLEDDLGEDVTFNPLENLHVKVESADPSEDGKGHDIVLTFRAIKEKLMQETVTLTSSTDQTKKIVMVLNARVLGKGKGTPALKKGIHCVRVEWDEDSDNSDWQGF